MSDRTSTPCQDSDPNLWWSTRPTVRARAVVACEPCPIREACLRDALRDGETDGVWGGLDLTTQRLLTERRAQVGASASALADVQAKNRADLERALRAS